MASVELRGKRAIVTGASSGIGEATVKQLREAGARVAGGARRVDAIDADVALELDVTDRASCATFLERALEELGGVDILVNNAGLALGREPFVESTEEDEHTVVETNISGLVRITTLAPGLVETEGFSLVRFRGDEEKARAVYKDVGLGGPIHAEDVADCIMFALTRPPHVNVDEIVVMALAQSSGARIVRS